MAGIKEVDASGLKQLIDSGEKITLVDIRSEDEYKRGIIENGELMPLHTVPARIQDLPKDETIVFYCHSGARSSRACDFVEQNTNMEIIHLSGGIVRWSQAGYPVVRPMM